jgi:hypothetical protein
VPYKTWVTNDVPSPADFGVLFGDAQVNDVATAQTTTSTSFVNLTTVGPTVSSVTLTAGQQVIIILQCSSSISGGPGHEAQMGFAVSGAATVAAVGADATQTQSIEDAMITRICVYTAPSAGSYTFTAKYCAVNATTANFANRRLIVIRR